MFRPLACGALALLMAACSGSAPRKGGARPDWADGAGASYPRDKYLTGTASAEDPETAKDRARAEISKIFSTRITAGTYSSASEFSSSSPDRKLSYSAQDAAQSVKAVSEKELEGVEIAAAWRDPADGRHYALAVLERRKALLSLLARLAALDERAAGLDKARAAAPGPVGRAAPAFKLLDLLRERETLAADLRTVSPGADTAAAFDLNAARHAAAAALAALGVYIEVAPEGLEKVSAEITKALNALGLQAAAGRIESDIAVDCTAAFEAMADTDPNSRWKWQRGTASVAMKDSRAGRTFLSFTATAKEAAASAAEARQKAEAALGRRIGAEITKGVKLYFENQ